MSVAGGLTVLAGAALYWLESDGFTSAWRTSGLGIGFGTGAVAGLLGFIFGIMISWNNSALGQLKAKINDKPTNEQAEKLAAIQRSLAFFGSLNAIFLILETILMAIARYIVL
jgi:hypothetical protein